MRSCSLGPTEGLLLYSGNLHLRTISTCMMALGRSEVEFTSFIIRATDVVISWCHQECLKSIYSFPLRSSMFTYHTTVALSSSCAISPDSQEHLYKHCRNKPPIPLWLLSLLVNLGSRCSCQLVLNGIHRPCHKRPRYDRWCRRPCSPTPLKFRREPTTWL